MDAAANLLEVAHVLRIEARCRLEGPVTCDNVLRRCKWSGVTLAAARWAWNAAGHGGRWRGLFSCRHLKKRQGLGDGPTLPQNQRLDARQRVVLNVSTSERGPATRVWVWCRKTSTQHGGGTARDRAVLSTCYGRHTLT